MHGAASFEPTVRPRGARSSEFRIEGVDTNLAFLRAALHAPGLRASASPTALHRRARRRAGARGDGAPTRFVPERRGAANERSAGVKVDTGDPLAVLDVRQVERADRR